MNGDVNGDTTYEKLLASYFGFTNKITKVIARDLSVAPMAKAFVFIDDKKDLYSLIVAKPKLTVSDVRKLLSKMNLKPESYLPPKSNPKYFNKVATAKFLEVYPGRKNISDQELMFYKTLVPYNPALVKIAEVKNGVIRSYDSDARGSWRSAVKLEYGSN